MNILFTSVGRRVELVQQFHQAADVLKTELKIIGVDISETAPALFFCDKARRICRINDPRYLEELLAICVEEQVQLVIPTIDTDLLLLAKHRRDFEEKGIRVLISAPDKVAICRDKNQTSRYFMSLGLSSPEAVNDVALYRQGFPAFIKPKDGSSSINAYKVETEDELNTYAKHIGDYVIQPFVSGVEYTVDVLCGFEGRPIYVTSRKRLLVRSGEVIKTEINNDPQIVSEILALIDDFKPYGPITVQLIRNTTDDKDYFIEINPRFGGGSPLSMKAGADSAQALIKLMQGGNVEFNKNAAREGAIYSRFDQSVCVR